MNLTKTLTDEYSRLWQTCAVRPARTAAADAIVDRIVANKKRYAAAGKPHGVPWYVIGIIHVLESSGDFTRHLHNGDPLSGRTVRVPAGRPKTGRPPFTWEASASDAVAYTGLGKWNDWSVPGTLYVLERYNGFGYRGRGIHSPYLWSFSNHYSKGKYVRDGVWSPTAVSQQCGAGVLLFRMVERGLVKIAGAATNGSVPRPAADGILRRGAKGPEVKQLKAQLKKWFDASSPGEWAAFKISGNDVFGAGVERAVRTLQGRVGLLVDGEVGPDTRAALKAKPPKPAPPPKVKDLAFPGVLKRGARGEPVRLVQCWLSLHDCAVRIDADYAAATEKAVRKLQAKRRLPVTGVVDRATWDALVAPMAAALTPIQKRDALGSLVVAYARQHLKQSPREMGGENSGPWVRLYTDGLEGRAYPWCAGFATYCLKQACDTLGVAMPLPRTLACDVMASSAGARFVRGKPARLTPGSFFLLRAKPGQPWKYAHTGIVVSSGAETMETIEGNTNDDGSYEGYEVCARTRGYNGMDFVVL